MTEDENDLKRLVEGIATTLESYVRRYRGDQEAAMAHRRMMDVRLRNIEAELLTLNAEMIAHVEDKTRHTD